MCFNICFICTARRENKNEGIFPKLACSPHSVSTHSEPHFLKKSSNFNIIIVTEKLFT